MAALYGRNAPKMLLDCTAVAERIRRQNPGASIETSRPSQRLAPACNAQVSIHRKDGQIVDTSIVRKRFLESALQSGAGPVRATRIWNDMLFGDSYARQLIEKVCEIEIVEADAGFGFLE